MRTQDDPGFSRRNLPHWHPEGATVFVTWRLFGSLPRHAIEQYVATKRLLERQALRGGESKGDQRRRHAKQLFVIVDRILDAASDGPLWLSNPDIAEIVERALLQRYAHLYNLWAYVVMANHVHVFFQPKVLGDKKATLAQVMKRLKGYTALEANRLLGRTGSSFWQQESYDHWARDEGNFVGSSPTSKITL